MEKPNSALTLRAAIVALEAKQLAEGMVLKQEFHSAYESIKPINLIKSTIHEISSSDDLKDNLVNTGVGLAVGYASKMLFEGTSTSPVKKLMGTALLFGITNTIQRNPEMVKAVGIGLFRMLRERLKPAETE